MISKFKKIFATTFLLITISMIWVILDKYFPIFEIKNYSDICLVIWQVQSTVATLSVLGLSLFTSLINLKFFGINYSDIISMEINVWGFSYWEIMLLSIILIPVNLIGNLFGSMTSEIFIFIVDFIAVYEIIKSNINLLNNHDKVKNLCRQKVLDSISTNDALKYIKDLYQDTRESFQKNDILKFQENFDLFNDLLKNIIVISQKYSEETSEEKYQQLLGLIQVYLSEFFEMFIQQSTPEKITEQLDNSINSARNYRSKNSKLFLQKNYLNIILRQSNNLESDKRINQLLLLKVSDCLMDQFNSDEGDISTDLLLLLYRFYILNLDEEGFSQLTTKLLTSSDTREKKQELLSIICIYLYYLCFYNSEFSQYTSRERVKILSGFNKLSTIQNHSVNISLQSFILWKKTGFFTHYFQIKEKLDLNWEYRSPYVQSRGLSLNNAIDEFFTFIGCCFFNEWSNIESINKFEIKDLLLIYDYFDENGEIKNDYKDEYKAFRVWIGLDDQTQQDTKKFYRKISDIIMKKNIDNYVSLHNHGFVRSNFTNFRIALIEDIKKSPLCQSVSNQTQKIVHEEILPLNFLVNNYFYSFRESLEREAMSKNGNRFHSTEVWFVSGEKKDNLKDILDSLNHLHSIGVIVDKYFNARISDRPYSFLVENEEIIKKFLQMESQLQDAGNLLNQNYPIYIDSTKFDIYFSKLKVKLVESLDSYDVDNYLSSQGKFSSDTYLFNIEGVDVYMDESSAREFIKIAFIKIQVEAMVTLGKQISGLIIKQKEISKGNSVTQPG